MIIENLLIHHDKTLIDALLQLNQLIQKENLSRPILFIVDDEKKILGSITDGDIRRSLLDKKNVEEKLINVCNKQFTFINETNGYVDYKTYRERDIKILPVLNADKKLIKILDLCKLEAQLPLECVIMAGGRGKRLSPLTDGTPKPMLMLCGKPIMEHIIDRLIRFGITKFYLSVGYLAEQIEEYFGDGKNKEINIEYIYEKEPLGTAGALSLVKDFKSEEVLLMNGDILTNIDFEHMYIKMKAEKADMILASTEYKVDIPYAVLKSHQSVVEDIVEKPTKVFQSNAGIYILRKDLVNQIPKNQFYDITDLMVQIIKDGKKLVYDPIIGYWKDIGDKQEYEQAKNLLEQIKWT